MEGCLLDAVLTPAPGIAWSTEQGGLYVVDEASGQTYRLTGLCELLWECLTQQFTYAQIIAMLIPLHAGSRENAERAAGAMLREWNAAGLVVLAEDGSHG